jgi:hypothetical protein
MAETEDKSLKDVIIEHYPDENDLIFWDGLDSAIIGVDTASSKVIYSVTKIIDALVEQDMTPEEALDWYGFNIECAYVGKSTPILCQDGFMYL